MNKEELKELYFKALDGMAHDGEEFEAFTKINMLTVCYIRMFGEVPHVISTDCDNLYRGEEVSETDPVDVVKTSLALAEKFKDSCFVCRFMDARVIVMDHCLLGVDEDSIYGCCPDEFFNQDILNCIVHEEHDDVRHMHYVIQSSQGFSTMAMDVKKQETDIKTNYNDDFPYDQIVDFINSDESGIVILHGIPGVGKTTLLRNLIYEVDKKHRFVFLDSSVFGAITDASFIRLLIDYKDAVIVLEDCETLLEDRVRGNNQLSALLNLSDGILGDSLNLKFICTFNADLTRIDKALLRKGRMKLKYEFKALSAEKTQALAKALGKDIPEGKSLPLCDIYNWGEDNGVKIPEKRVIGFGV